MFDIKGKRICAAAFVVTSLAGSDLAFAGQKWDFGNDAWLSVGAGLRATFRDTDGDSNTTLDSARIYLNGQANKILGFTLDTEFDHDPNGGLDKLRILDAILRLEFNDYFNVWGGRFVPPGDRANSSGAYYLGIWDFPFVQNFPAYWLGRDQGVAVWGQTGGGKFRYSAGVFQGCNGDSPCASSADGNSPLMSARLSYAFWDPEPGYYLASDYYGTKEILSVGVSGTYQADATGTASNPGDYTGFNFDFLMQKKVLDGGVFTLEGSYYHYDTDGRPTPLVSGNGYFLLSSYLLPYEIGIGKFQPIVRYQNLDRNDGGYDISRWEGGVNYIIKGHDARLSAMYAETDYKGDGLAPISSFSLGVQLQY